MRWPLALFCAMTLAALAGCASKRGELLERELRARDCDLQDLRGELERSEGYNRALQMELGSIRGDYNPMPGDPGASPHGPPPLYPVRYLTLGRGTGGYDNTGCAGDTALQVVLEPRDCDNHIIKVPAAAMIQALEITPEGLKKLLCAWEVPPEQMRNSWRSGLLNTGFVIVLPWKAFPTCQKLRVIATLKLPDGRVYEADKDITVKLVPPGQRLMPSVEEKRGDTDPPLPKEKRGDADPLLPKPRQDLEVPGEPIPVPPKPGPGLGPTLPPMPSADKSQTRWGPPQAVPSTIGIEMLKPVVLQPE